MCQAPASSQTDGQENDVTGKLKFLLSFVKEKIISDPKIFF